MTTYTAVMDGSKTNVEGHSKFLNRVFGPGVAMALNPNSLKVVQRGAGANMSVDVSTGDAHLQLPSTTYSYWSWTDAVTNVALSTADTTNPRIDTIIGWVDPTVTTTVSNNSPGSFKLQSITGTPAGTPISPTDSAIQTALGSSIAWVRLGDVAVAANATNIVTANITDMRPSIQGLLKVSSSRLNISETPDANGWMVYDFGTFKRYTKSATVSPGSIVANGVVTIFNGISLPVGVATLGTLNFSHNVFYSNDAGGNFYSYLKADTNDVAAATKLYVFARNQASSTAAGGMMRGVIELWT